ncbi:GDP-fucose protein O-fucosyltransferase [Corchorus olitorius]|uniref:O-fucosyltransferase family protein n=1 Tax=Corchorus olitorius TaxID=93759 RepID=A0A1R3FVF7_9ROSI|nr:GDP-fucose protein O-fucosyltransferase [Corchorus olitorius]
MAAHIATSMKPKSNTNNTNGNCNNGSNGYSSESSSGTNSNSPSPPPSPPQPRLAPSLSQCRRRLRSKTHSFVRRENNGSGLNFRRNLRYLVVLPLLYISGLFMCVGPVSELLGYAYVPGSVVTETICFFLLQLSSVWKYKRRSSMILQFSQRIVDTGVRGQLLYDCFHMLVITSEDGVGAYKSMLLVNVSFLLPESPGSSGYLIVDANGGLNQQRSALCLVLTILTALNPISFICNAVAVAGLLNAILVIPQFELNSVWRDPSQFGDIYDVDHFIDNLKGYVNVVRELPEPLMERYDHNISNIPNLRVQAWAPVNYYLGVVHPILMDQGVIRIAPFANRLAMNVPPHIQLLRCIANYKALKFSLPIGTLAEKLVDRMIEKSSRTGGKYVSVHLRFEQDMVAFSCCVYDGGQAEKSEMDSFREKGWKGKFKRKDRIIIPALNRVEGKCPLTPVEVGLMLRGMGFDNNTAIYLASGKIYQAEKHLAPLLKMFPLLYTKESLATPDELAPFEGYSSRLAALDYTVSLFSEVFVTTQGGNFPHFLMGHRRFLFDGHAKTIKPDKRKLVVLLQDMGISWKAFKDEMEAMLADSDRKGMMVPRVKKFNRKTSIYTYPLPECACLRHSQNSTLRLPDSANVLDSYHASTR